MDSNIAHNTFNKIIKSTLRIRYLLFLSIFLILITSVLYISLYKPTQTYEMREDLTAKKIQQECSRVKANQLCIAQKLSDLTQKTNLSLSKKVLQRLQYETSLISDCHLAAHLMARAEVRKDPSKWEQIMQDQNPYECTGGFMHGIIEEHYNLNSKSIITADTIKYTCRLFESNELKKGNCIHAMGHLLLVQFYGDLGKAVDICNELLIDDIPYQCYYGVFMEHNTGVSQFEHGLRSKLIGSTTPILVKNMEQYCSELKGNAAIFACWSEMGRLYMLLYNYDLHKTLESCNKAPAEAMSYCGNVAISGALFIKKSLTDDYTKNLCDEYTELSDNWKNCVFRIISVLMQSNINYTSYAINFCSFISPLFKNSCYIKIIYSLKGSDSSKQIIEKECKKLPQDYRKKCINLLTF